MRILTVQIAMRSLCAGLLISLAAIGVQAGVVSGVVRNGTTNKPAGQVDVLLIQLQGGMQTIANTKSDAEGRYGFDNAAIGSQPMLIRAVYHGVNFHQPLTPGAAAVDVTVYEPTTDARSLEATVRLMVLQPTGDKLLVGEEYSLKNASDPPTAFYKQDGNFEFALPANAELEQVSVVGPSGMPVTQGTIDKGEGRFTIAYAFQPGQSAVRLSYQLPYPDNQAKFRGISSIDVQRVLLVAPPTMQVSSPGFSPAGTEQGFNVYARDLVKAGTSFDVSVSGTAPPPDEGADQTNGRASGLTVQSLPARLNNEKWILLGGLAAIFAVGVGLLLRRPVQGAVAVPAAAMPTSRKARKRAAASEAPASPSAAEKVNRDVDANLESLKDALLRLELRRQAGTISEEEYARERGRTEQTLRQLVQG